MKHQTPDQFKSVKIAKKSKISWSDTFRSETMFDGISWSEIHRYEYDYVCRWFVFKRRLTHFTMFNTLYAEISFSVFQGSGNI